MSDDEVRVPEPWPEPHDPVADLRAAKRMVAAADDRPWPLLTDDTPTVVLVEHRDRPDGRWTYELLAVRREVTVAGTVFVEDGYRLRTWVDRTLMAVDEAPSLLDAAGLLAWVTAIIGD